MKRHDRELALPATPDHHDLVGGHHGCRELYFTGRKAVSANLLLPAPASAPVQLRLDLHGGWSPAAAARSRRQHRRGIHRCESPLERQLAFAFTALDQFTWRGPSDHLWQLGRWKAHSLVLIAQAEWMSYHADFALVPIDWKPREALPLVIEVDGHDFHERTKEQAEHDRRRDRLMTEAGSTVLRFTGREVWRDARACATEVLDYATRHTPSPAGMSRAML